ncbi:alpha-1,4 glucan phosphorylase L isozyme, chloroplastic/amyloplastic-like [Euphorbia lathyris]|uniref:alpha-1,4 glucan phosphorylase L isozyme, chloroplastic/amyloplastic-like n=1 Tax=Euphorbia lathyris TaxID=212925 RepID=UPI0033144415
MEFLQGRALLNAIDNLELSGVYAEVLQKLGHNLEDVANQEEVAENGLEVRLKNVFSDGESMGEIIRNDILLFWQILWRSHFEGRWN